MVNGKCIVSPQWSQTNNKKSSGEIIAAAVRMTTKHTMQNLVATRKKIFNVKPATYHQRNILCLYALTIFTNVKPIFVSKEPTGKIKLAKFFSV